MTNVRFSSDNQKVISTGGEDHSVFQWRYIAQGSGEDDLPDHGNGDFSLSSLSIFSEYKNSENIKRTYPRWCH